MRQLHSPRMSKDQKYQSTIKFLNTFAGSILPKSMFVIDIEGRGKSASRNGIVSIGVCIGAAHSLTGQPVVLEKRRFDLLPLPGQSMDPQCKAEFWDQQPNNLLETLQQNAVDAEIGIFAFRDYLDKFDLANENVYVLSDNPAYDFAFIDWYLDHFKIPTLAYKWNGKSRTFRALHDADSYARGKSAGLI